LFELAARGLASEGPVRVSEGFALSADGTRIATAGGSTTRVWDAATGKPLTPPMRHRYDLQAAVFSCDSRTLITTGSLYQTQLWDAGSGEPLTPSVPGQRFPALTADGRLLLQGFSTLLYDVRPDERPVETLRLVA